MSTKCLIINLTEGILIQRLKNRDQSTENCGYNNKQVQQQLESFLQVLEQQTNEEVKPYLQANTLNQHEKLAMTTIRSVMTITSDAMTKREQGMTI